MAIGPRSLGAVLAAVLVTGCAAERAADRHVAELGDALGKIQADQDKENRRSALLDTAPLEGEPRGPASAAPARGRPPAAPRAVQLGDDDERRESDDPNDPNARPEIRLQGSGGGAVPRAVRGKSGRHVDRDDAWPASPSSSAAGDGKPSVLDPEAKRAYEAALAQVQGKQYDRGLEGLSAFLAKWPDHPYAENAMYWRGEAYFARGEYLRAAEQFEAVLSRFNGNKAPDALLKIGMCHERLGAGERAKEYWERLRREHPRSEAVKRIPSARTETRQDTRHENEHRGPGPR